MEDWVTAFDLEHSTIYGFMTAIYVKRPLEATNDFISIIITIINSKFRHKLFNSE